MTSPNQSGPVKTAIWSGLVRTGQDQGPDRSPVWSCKDRKISPVRQNWTSPVQLQSPVLKIWAKRPDLTGLLDPNLMH